MLICWMPIVCQGPREFTKGSQWVTSHRLTLSICYKPSRKRNLSLTWLRPGMLLNHTKVSGNTGFRLAGTQNTQFFTHQLLTTPSRMLWALCSRSPQQPQPHHPLHLQTEEYQMPLPHSIAAPWVTCLSRKPHNDAIWELGLLVQDTHPTYRLGKHLKSQGEWQWISTRLPENLPQVLWKHPSYTIWSCHFIHSCNSSPSAADGAFQSTGPPDPA